MDPLRPNLCNAGAVFAYQRQDDDWELQQKIAPEELGEQDGFGQSIAMEGSRAVVGAFGDDEACPNEPPSLSCNPGAVYLFELIDDQWQAVDKLTATDADSSDVLGIAVAISGSHVIAGAPRLFFNDNPKPGLGAAYLFKIFNRDPVAQDDQATTSQNTPVEIDVLANDNDPDFDKITLKASLLAGPSNGTVTVSDTAISYTPAAGFAGIDALTYEIDDGGTAQANVTINVASVNAASVVAQAIDETTLVLGGDDFTSGLSTVFSDPNGDALTFSASSSDAAVATATVSGQTLTVEAVALGSATITVVADDGNGGTASTSFTVNVPTAVAVKDRDPGLPTTFALEPNYPNPFNPETRIRFGLPQSSEVRLAVFDVLGREVTVLVEARLEAGWHEATFEVNDLPSGVYVYPLQTARQTLSRTMLLLK